MKYTLIIALLFSISVQAQTLDTILIRDKVTMTGTDWAWVVGKHNNVFQDSATAREFRRIRESVLATPNLTYNSNISIDSLRGTTVLWIYQTVKTANAGEIVSRYTAMINAVNKPVLAYWYGLFDGALLADYNRSRDRGKTLLIDQ